MGTRNFVWSFTKKFITFGLITVTVSDRYVTVVPVRDDYVLVEKLCLQKYKFSHGDVVIFRSPLDYKETHIKRIIALPGEWFVNRQSHDVLKIPEGHCWVEGDNVVSSSDSKSYGPIPLGLIRGRVTHVVWPPQRIGAVKSTTPERLPSL
ncbi:uncharacterized protein [Cicer arietinum]|uniref:Mitochondrial inner membrane protease subunit 2 n=1 Tax=Cicer arietinum TaxID=3827 RepID=A0A1S2YXC5_CICAR|nr:mitochondrial inner membrane protease subunit 2 isoform X2 [Cicer arietinum]XP_012574345.1 mitochondrial inner membrane protease subunit 2 isoform X2 [Cicer arietinum]